MAENKLLKEVVYSDRLKGIQNIARKLSWPPDNYLYKILLLYLAQCVKTNAVLTVPIRRAKDN